MYKFTIGCLFIITEFLFSQNLYAQSELDTDQPQTSQQCRIKKPIANVPKQIEPGEGLQIETIAQNIQSNKQPGPTSVAVDSQGNIFIASRETPGIFKIPAGQSQPIPFLSILSSALKADGVAVDSQDNVIVAGDAVLKFDPKGGLIWRRTCEGNLQSVAVAPDDTIYVGTLSSHICKLSKEGQVEKIGSIYRPAFVSAGPDNYIYISQLLNRSPTSVFKATVEEAKVVGIEVNNVVGGRMAFDPNGSLYFRDSRARQIIRIHPEKKYRQAILSKFSGASGFDFDKNGALYVANQRTKELYKVSPIEWLNAPDITIDRIELDDKNNKAPHKITVHVVNQGDASIESTLLTVVEKLSDDQSLLLARQAIPALSAKQKQQITLEILAPIDDFSKVMLILDSSREQLECNEDNNQTPLVPS